MKLDLRALMAGEIRVLPVHVELVPQIDPDDRLSSLYGVRFPSGVIADGEITNTAGYMRMCLALEAGYVVPCARCLDDVCGTFSYTVERTVAPASMLEDVPEDRLDDYIVIENGFIDIDDMLLELVELAFPTKFLCREDCPGLCVRCGKKLSEGNCNCSTKEIDPRLEPLRRILEEMQAEEAAKSGDKQGNNK